MKKLTLLLAVSLTLVAGLTSCDNSELIAIEAQVEIKLAEMDSLLVLYSDESISEQEAQAIYYEMDNKEFELEMLSFKKAKLNK